MEEVDDRVEDMSVGFVMVRSGPSLRAYVTKLSTLKEVCARKEVCQKLRLHCVSDFARIRGSLLPRIHALHVIGQSAETLIDVEAPCPQRPYQTPTTSLESS
jgi:hypothetical protein